MYIFGVKSKDFSKIRQIRLFRQGILCLGNTSYNLLEHLCGTVFECNVSQNVFLTQTIGCTEEFLKVLVKCNERRCSNCAIISQ